MVIGFVMLVHGVSVSKALILNFVSFCIYMHITSNYLAFEAFLLNAY